MKSRATILIEKYLTRSKSSFNKDTFEVFEFPTRQDYKDLGDIIRFTANLKTKKVYAWKYDQGYHVDVSKAIGIKHSYNDPTLLMGTAMWQSGKWYFQSSDGLKSAKRMTGAEREYVEELINQDWSWVNKYIEVDDFLKMIRTSLGV